MVQIHMVDMVAMSMVYMVHMVQMDMVEMSMVYMVQVVQMVEIGEEVGRTEVRGHGVVRALRVRA